MRAGSAAALLGWGGAFAARADTPPCTAHAALEPPRAFVGQQVLYRVEIHSREDVGTVEWIRQPVFPEIRTEMLPGGPRPEVVARDGTRLRAREEQRAFYGERAGRFTLRSEGLRCALRGGAHFDAPVPEVVLELMDPPAAGQPPGYTGLVGPVSLHVTVTPERVPLGGSVRVAVLLRGEGNLWDAPAPFSANAFGEADVFPRRPELRLERGARLFVSRHFAYDVVPRREGALELPAVRLPYFDPQAGRYALAEAAATQVVVLPRPVVAEPPARERPVQTAEAEPATDRTRLLLALALAAALAAIVWAVARRRDGGGSAAALEAARAARTRGDAEAEATALARALRGALAPHVPDAAALAAEELAARGDLRAPVAAAAHALADVERARFDPEAPPADAAAVERAIAGLA